MIKWLQVACLSAAMMAGGTYAADDVAGGKFDTNKAMTSYALGVQTARTVTMEGGEIDVDQFVAGLKAQLDKQPLRLSEDELRQVLVNYQAEARRSQKTKRALASGENNRKGREFLEQNKSKEGVQTLSNGLQYKVLKAGEGAKPKDADTVLCHYRGTTVGGEVFDASQEGTPAKLKVSQLIRGFREALLLMPVGSKWQIVIPSNLAYGQRSVGNVIGPNETLIFDVELVGIQQ